MVFVLGGASLSLAIFPKRARQRVQEDKNIKNKRQALRFLRTKMAVNGALLVLLGVLLCSRWASNYLVGTVAIVLLFFSYYTERRVKKSTQ